MEPAAKAISSISLLRVSWEYLSTRLIIRSYMTLEDRLSKIREGSTKRIPPAALKVMHRATNDLRESGVLSEVIKVGDAMPPFSLSNTRGEPVNSDDLLARGPLVTTFFRGYW